MTILVVGDVVEDIIVTRTGPIRQATDTPSRVMRRRGGSAANVAVAAAEQGASVRFVGCVGPDAGGRFCTDSLRERGVDVVSILGTRTGSIVVLVDPDTGERSMLTDRGASGEYDTVPADAFAEVTLLHLTSYSLAQEPTRTACLRAAGQVHLEGGLVTVDASSTGLIEDTGISEILITWELLQPDIIFANEDEAEMLGLPGAYPLGGSTVVVKHGAKPTSIFSRSGQLDVEVPAVESVIDTTGAGDAFAGGFLAALDPSRRDDLGHLQACCEAAHAASREAIQRVGA